MNTHTYHTFTNGGQHGPFTRGQLETQLMRGTITRATLCAAAGTQDWQPLETALALPALEVQRPTLKVQRSTPPLARAAALFGWMAAACGALFLLGVSTAAPVLHLMLWPALVCAVPALVCAVLHHAGIGRAG